MLLGLLLLFCSPSPAAPTPARDGIMAGFITHRPKDDVEANIAEALDLLRRCETGRKALAAAGLSVDQEISSIETLRGRSIEIRVADLKGDHALTRLPLLEFFKRAILAVSRGAPPRGESTDSLVIVLRRPIALAAPRILAPVLAHELSHVKDYRESIYSLEMMAASERHGWMAQTHTAIELAEQGFLPGSSPRSNDEAALAAAQWTLVDVWNGLPLKPPDRYGREFIQEVSDFNDYISAHPGLPALVAYGDLMTRLGFDIGPWTLNRDNPSPAARALDDALLDSDRRFSERRRRSRPDASASRFPSPPPSPWPQDDLPLAAEPPPKPMEVAIPPQPPMEVAVPPSSPPPGSANAEPQPHAADDGSSQKPDNIDLDPARKAIKKAAKAKVP
ncbi:MAG: hypothetical protein HY748_13280 [Elusimicrobia bacterium]|nr:hypothetical protein [Elusimicrobiota bacterium]